MSTSYIGEIRMFGGNFAPAGWAFCNGQLLPISEFDALFNLIGTTYGGDGQSTFQLPSLQCRIPIHAGQGPGLPYHIIGEPGGLETVTLITNTLPAHTHPFMVSTSSGTSNSPNGSVPGASPNIDLYVNEVPAASLNAAALQPAPASGNQPHDNMHPFLAINFIISLYGVWPYQG